MPNQHRRRVRRHGGLRRLGSGVLTVGSVATVAVTSRGIDLFTSLGFQVHRYREGGPRAFCWADAKSLGVHSKSFSVDVPPSAARMFKFVPKAQAH